MDPVSLFVLGLELTRFPGADDSAASLGDSLEVIEAGGLSLAPYRGPALQPVFGWRSRHVELTLAPGLAGRAQDASSSDGRTVRVHTLEYRGEVRGWGRFGPALAGLDVGVSGGRGTAGGKTVATAPVQLELAPTGGVHTALGDHLDLSLRARWPIRISQGALEQGLSGAVSLEWHPVGN